MDITESDQPIEKTVQSAVGMQYCGEKELLPEELYHPLSILCINDISLLYKKDTGVMEEGI